MASAPEYSRSSREDAPFLPETTSDDTNTPTEPKSLHQNNADSAAAAKKIGFRLKLILFLMILAVDIGFAFLEGPMVRILESIACRQYFAVVDPSKIGANGYIPEDQCKLPEVQSELAAVKGYHMFFDGLLSMFMFPRAYLHPLSGHI
jgi:hypothetical protein